MRRMLLIGHFLIAILLIGPSFAGEILTCFKQGELGSCSRPALQHVKFKSVVLQFVDPAKSGLGESLSRLLWREILESISDLSGAGVILAYDREGDIEGALGQRDLGAFLEQEYHAAANAIAEQQKVQMAIWGAVLKDGDEIFVQTFLTLRQEGDDAWTALSFSSTEPAQVRLSALLGRQRLNLMPLRGTKTDLFSRNWVTRCALDMGCPRGIALRERASNDSPVTAFVPVGSQVKAIDMNRQWLKVSRQGADPAWINIYHVEMLPRSIEFFDRRNVNLRARPGGSSIARVNLDGAYQVNDAQRHGQYGEPWYFIEVGSRRGWIAGRLVNRRSYTFPAVHLIAGLYRYGRSQFRKAQEEFEAFLAQSPNEDNVTQATVLQFLAASRVAGQRNSTSKGRQALSDLDLASKLTPFDAKIYSLRAVVRVGAEKQMVSVVADLEQALELNKRDPTALRLLHDMSRISERYGLDVFVPGGEIGNATHKLKALEHLYIKPQ